MKIFAATTLVAVAASTAALLIAPSMAAPAPAAPAPAPMISPAPEQNPTGGCIYSLAGSVKLFCEYTQEDFCKPHMGGFVTASYYPGETCAELKKRGEY